MAPDRRTLLRAGLSATAALVSPIDLSKSQPQDDTRERPHIDGEVSCAADARAAAGEDFGRIVHAKPQMVVRPKSSADVANVVRWAAARKLKVAARGHGHSTYGRPLADGGVVIDMTPLKATGEIASKFNRSEAPDRIVADAGATWSDILDATLKRGMTPPVLTNYLDLTIGGTITIGGIGGSSSRHGLQADNVLELQIVTGDGRELTCSPSLNADLFDAARAGLGQCGIITRATLRLIRAPERVRRVQLHYPDLAALTGDQQLLLAEERFDQLQGAVLPDGKGGWRYLLEAAIFYNHDAPDEQAALQGLSNIRGVTVTSDLGYSDDAHAFAKFEAVLRTTGHWFNSQPWLLTFLPESSAEQVAREIIGRLSYEDLGSFGRVIFYPLRRGAFRLPLARMPDGAVAYVFNVVRIPDSKDIKQIEWMIADNRSIYQRVREAGGVLYPVSAFPMSPDDWRMHFGSAWPQLRDAKRRYDPNDLLTPGYNVT